MVEKTNHLAGKKKEFVFVINPPFAKEMIKEGRCEQETSLFQSTYPSFTMAYIASILREKYDTKILDCIAGKIDEAYLQNEVKKKQPEYAFVNTTTPTFESDIAIVKRLLEVSSQTVFFLYGVHASYFSENISNNIILLKGEPETKAFELIGRTDVEFKDYPFPAWDLVNIQDYRLNLKNKPFLIIQTSRGCSYSCSFCTAPFYYGKKYRKRQVKSIIEEIKYDMTFGVKDFLFYSEIFTLDKGYVKDICKALLKSGIKISWMCNSRVDTIDDEILSLMKEAGCWMISVGIESASQKVLDLSHKNYRTDKAKEIIKKINGKGILTIGHFIFGLPGETEKIIEETIRMSNDISVDIALYYIATPFPGSELYETHKNSISSYENILYSQNSINNDIDLKKYLSYAYKSFYINPKRLITLFRLMKAVGITNLNNLLFSGIKSAIHIIKG
jgi:radical SAM superfamily enzyme YgiQ (UPF0313 family)